MLKQCFKFQVSNYKTKVENTHTAVEDASYRGKLRRVVEKQSSSALANIPGKTIRDIYDKDYDDVGDKNSSFPIAFILYSAANLFPSSSGEYVAINQVMLYFF